jgi:coenzyme F420-reducing hydrogenase delta subunit
MKKVVAYCGFNFSNDSAYLRMPDAFSSQSDEKRLEIVNQLIEELTKEKERIEMISQLETQGI